MNEIYQPTDIVLAKVKGFPPWPAMIIPRELIPENVWKTRSRASKEVGGDDDEVNDSVDEFENNANSDDYIIYSKVLKFKKNKEQKTLYCVKFFCDDSYIWVKPSDMHLLNEDECIAFLNSPGRKNKKLIPAYEMAMKGSSAIDIWEFVEYGSQGNPDEDEYVEDESEFSRNTRRRSTRVQPTRSSSRQRQKLMEETEAEETKPSRRTRTRSKNVTTKGTDSEVTEELDELEQPRTKRAKREPAAKVKGPAKKSTAVKKSKKPEIEYYKFEDDEDWQIVGLGPQDLSISKGSSSVIKRLSKKNLEKHSELRLDLEDKLGSINRLLELVLYKLAEKKPKKDKSLKTDLEIIIDEFDIALNIKGSRTEYLTVFNSNNHLIMNFRILFNLARDQLVEWKLWDDFQSIFNSIYGCSFIRDQGDWKTLDEIDMEEKKQAELEAKEKIERDENLPEEKVLDTVDIDASIITDNKQD